MLLRPCVKNYPWGKIGPSSLVWEFYAASAGEKVELKQDEPYAELWMGTHTSGPSILQLENGETIPLNEYVSKDPSVLGANVTSTFGPNLPFLFKILSVKDALSIQAHPNKQLAAELHSRDPKNYPDANHKPEMAIAITPFEVLCGFRGLDEINRFMQEIPELQEVTGCPKLQTEDDLRKAYKQLMTFDTEAVKSIIKGMLKRKSIPEHELITRLNEQFPGDIGILNVYFLQHFVLQPGEAMFLPANEPHAYIFGDCAECMANSDNVVRAGLTPKFKDVDVLVKMLTFHTGKNWLFQGISTGQGRTLFRPPIADFAVERIEGQEVLTLDSTGSCSILLVIDGTLKLNGLNLSRGSIVFIPAEFMAKLEPVNNSLVRIFRAFCPGPCK